MADYINDQSSIVGYEILLDEEVSNQISNVFEEVSQDVSAIDRLTNEIQDANRLLTTARDLLNKDYFDALQREIPQFRISSNIQQHISSFRSAQRDFRGALETLAKRFAREGLRELGELAGLEAGDIAFIERAFRFVNAGGESRSRHDYESSTLGFLKFAAEGTLEFLSILPGAVGKGARLTEQGVSAFQPIQQTVQDPSVEGIVDAAQRFSSVLRRTQNFLGEIRQEEKRIKDDSQLYIGSTFDGTATGIAVIYADGSRYVWHAETVGEETIDQMIEFAEGNDGLGSFIFSNVRFAYS